MEWEDSLRYKIFKSILKHLARAKLKGGKSNHVR